MNTKCLFRYDDGAYCKRWAQKGSRFCYNHQPQGLDGPTGHDWSALHPFARLATPNDLFDLLRESLHATRTGAMTPAQAAGICGLSSLWLKVYDRLSRDERIYGIQQQILPTLVDRESAAHAERLAAAGGAPVYPDGPEGDRRAVVTPGFSPALPPDAAAAGPKALAMTEGNQDDEPAESDAGLLPEPMDLREAQATLQALLASQKM